MNPVAWLSERFELSRGGEGQNVRPMEGLRGFAVFLVFLVHYATLVEPWISDTPEFRSFNKALLNIGFTGVDLFFVLSGYLIYGSLLARAHPFGRFMARRIERIYPAFIAVFSLYIVLSFVFPAESKIPAEPVAAAMYLAQNFLLLPGLFDIRPMITVAWSLSYEMFYYLAIPIVIEALGLRDRTSTWRITFFLLVSIALAIGMAIRGGHFSMLMFVSGILLYEAMGKPSVQTPGSAVGLTALIVGLAGALVPLTGHAGNTFRIAVLCVTFFVVCLACFREPIGWFGRAFSCTPLRWLGNMSYSYYLLHGLALKGAFHFLRQFLDPAYDLGTWLFWLLLPLMFLLTLVPTALLFLFVERPFSLDRTRAAKQPRQPSGG